MRLEDLRKREEAEMAQRHQHFNSQTAQRQQNHAGNPLVGSDLPRVSSNPSDDDDLALDREIFLLDSLAEEREMIRQHEIEGQRPRVSPNPSDANNLALDREAIRQDYLEEMERQEESILQLERKQQDEEYAQLEREQILLDNLAETERKEQEERERQRQEELQRRQEEQRLLRQRQQQEQEERDRRHTIERRRAVERASAAMRSQPGHRPRTIIQNSRPRTIHRPPYVFCFLCMCLFFFICCEFFDMFFFAYAE